MKVSTLVLLATLAYTVSSVATDCWSCEIGGGDWTGSPLACGAAGTLTINDCKTANAAFAATATTLTFATADAYVSTTKTFTLAATTAYNFVFTNTLTDMAFTLTPSCGATVVGSAYAINGVLASSTYPATAATNWCTAAATVAVATVAIPTQTYSAVLYSTAGGAVSVLVEAGFFMQALSFAVAALLLAFY